MKRRYDAEARAKPHIRDLAPYVPGEQPVGEGWVKLNTNENPYPPSPRVKEAVAAEAEWLRLYPEPLSRRLRAAVAERFGCDADGVVIGNGSDNLLNLLARCFGRAPGIGQTSPSYSMYPVVAGLENLEALTVPFDRSMELDPDAIARTGASVFFLTSPNAPTGVAFSPGRIEAILERFDGLLAVDEAYADFGAETAVPLVREYGNLCVTRTMSKSHGLAGLRAGYAIADPEVASVLDRAREVYNVDRLAQAGALAALEDEAYFQRTRERVKATRERTRAEFDRLGWTTYPSAANFLFTEPRDAGGARGPDVAESLFEFLKARRILVRYFPGHPLTCAFLRVSVGTDEQMDAFMEAIQAWRNQG